MTEKVLGLEYIKISEAARLLGVTQRWIYRRIWNGDLPASKVGGFYFIRRVDLDGLLASGKVEPADRSDLPAAESQPMKCGYCFRVLESDLMVGEVCREEGCEILLCSECNKQGIRFCARHIPSREENLTEALERYKRGELKLLVRAADARLLEMNYLNRIQQRLARFSALMHPVSGELINIKDWAEILEEEDQRAEVMRLLNTGVWDAALGSRIPLNASLRYAVPRGRQRGGPLEVLVQALSRVGEMLRDGYDSEPLTVADLSAALLPAAEEAQSNQTATLLVLASVTGWDSAARLIVAGDAPGRAFSQRFLLPYLYDLQSGDLVYNRGDERARRYVELLVPLLESEEVQEAASALEKELLYHESITLEYARQILPFTAGILKKAFEQLAAGGKFILTELPELGPAVIRK